jgi:predicted transcriptional regulator
MKKPKRPNLTRREREIMEILYRRERSTAVEVMDDLSGNPHLSTVRTQLRLLEEKGYVKHEEEDLRYVYLPSLPQKSLKQSALKQLMDNFFEGSAAQVMTTLFDMSARNLSNREMAELQRLIDKTQKGRKG